LVVVLVEVVTGATTTLVLSPSDAPDICTAVLASNVRLPFIRDWGFSNHTGKYFGNCRGGSSMSWNSSYHGAVTAVPLVVPSYKAYHITGLNFGVNTASSFGTVFVYLFNSSDATMSQPGEGMVVYLDGTNDVVVDGSTCGLAAESFSGIARLTFASLNITLINNGTTNVTYWIVPNTYYGANKISSLVHSVGGTFPYSSLSSYGRCQYVGSPPPDSSQCFSGVTCPGGAGASSTFYCTPNAQGTCFNGISNSSLNTWVKFDNTFISNGGFPSPPPAIYEVVGDITDLTPTTTTTTTGVATTTTDGTTTGTTTSSGSTTTSSATTSSSVSSTTGKTSAKVTSSSPSLIETNLFSLLLN